jgi:site-specific recombinase XerD
MIANESKRRPIDVLTSGEVERLMSAVAMRSPLGRRHRAVIAVQYRGLLRISETFRLRLCDYDPTAGSLRIQHGKGDKYRVIGLDTFACATLDAWIAVRSTYAKQPDAPLFCSNRGGKVKRTSWNESLSRLAVITGLSKRIHPHGLRHSGACAMLRDGVDILIISRMLGHSNIATTHRYLAHLSAQDVIDAMRARPIPPELQRLITSEPTRRFSGDPLEFGCA